jgi:YVTN family beta-propeller protein
VSVVDLQTDKEIARIPAGQSPWGLVIVPNSH